MRGVQEQYLTEREKQFLDDCLGTYLSQGDYENEVPKIMATVSQLRESLEHAVSCMDRSCRQCNVLQAALQPSEGAEPQRDSK